MMVLTRGMRTFLVANIFFDLEIIFECMIFEGEPGWRSG